MDEFDITDLSSGIAGLADRDAIAIDKAALTAKLRDVLFGRRGFWLAYVRWILIFDEAIDGVVAHLETWLEINGVVPENDVQRYRTETMALIRETFERNRGAR